MIAWLVLAPIWFDEVVVLGPACWTSDCAEPARWRVWWPSTRGPARYCDRCSAAWRRLARESFALELAVERIEYAVGLDDAERRFSLLEFE